MFDIRESGSALLNVVFTTLILGALLYYGSSEQIFNSLEQANYGILFIAFFAANIPVLIHTAVWRAVLEKIGVSLSFLSGLQVVLSNIFINNITPFGNIGGEAAITYLLSRMTERPSGKVFSAVFGASVINFSPIGSLMLIGFVLTGYWFVAVSFILLLGLVYIFRESLFSSLRGFNLGIADRLSSFIDDFRESSELLLRERWDLLGLTVFTHLSVLFDIFSIVLIGYSLGVNLLGFEILLVVPLARVTNYAPTPGGSGPYEIALTGLLGFFFGIELSTAVIIAVIYRAITYYTGLAIGYIGYNSLHLSEL